MLGACTCLAKAPMHRAPRACDPGPLLPPLQFEQLTLEADREWPDMPPVSHPRTLGGGSGDAALDAAASTAAAIPLGSTAEQLAAAGQLAVALARHRRFQRLRLLPGVTYSLLDEVDFVDPVGCSLALRLARLSHRIDVDVWFDKQQ